MKSSNAQLFMLDDWVVTPPENLLLRRDKRIRLEPKAMDVLCHLSDHPHRVVSSDQLLEQCWPKTCPGENVVYKNIAILRKALGENEIGTKYIQTIPKRGYRLQAQVIPLKSTNIDSGIAERENLERILRILNRLTQKQTQVNEATLSNLNKYRKDNGLLLKISKRLLEYATGIPDFNDLP